MTVLIIIFVSATKIDKNRFWTANFQNKISLLHIKLDAYI